MNRRPCACRHCAAPTTQAPVTDPVHEPIVLPDRPRRFPVHHDCGAEHGEPHTDD